MESKTLHLEDIGNIILKKSGKARRLSIRVIPYEGISVSIPERTSYAEAERFIEDKRKWILQSLEKIRKYEAQHIIFDENTVFSTHEHTLKILYEERENIGVVVTKAMIYIKFPIGINIRHKRMQDVIKQAIEHTMKIEAQNYLPGRLKQLADQHNLTFKKVTIRNTETRWGSCAHDNSISLSLHLMRLPEDLIDYVLLHELAHTVHKNHGIHFWQMLEKISVNAKEKSRKMRKYHIGNY